MINLTEFLYDIKSRYVKENEISVTRVNNSICFSEETSPSPHAMHRIKVLIALNKLPFKEKRRKYKNLRESTTYDLTSLLVGDIIQNDLSFARSLQSHGYLFRPQIDSSFGLRLRHTLLADEPLTKCKFVKIQPLLEEIEAHAEKSFKDFRVKVTGSGRGKTSTYLDIDIFR